MIHLCWMILEGARTHMIMKRRDAVWPQGRWVVCARVSCVSVSFVSVLS